MWFRAVVIVILVVIPCTDVAACINIYGTDLHGHEVTAMDDLDGYASRLRAQAINREFWTEQKAELEVGLQSADFKQRSNYAAALTFLGDYQTAIEILLKVEDEQPGEYIVASNLGTAYELSGNDEEALVWIKKGLERDPTSHAGSEWLHVKILEAKLAIAQDANWLTNHTVLGLDFGQDGKPTQPHIDSFNGSQDPMNLEDIEVALSYQLSERVKFVSAPNAIVANLLFDYANVIALTKSVEQAVPLYDLAGEFGYDDETLLNHRIGSMKQVAATNPRSGQREGGDLPSVRAVLWLLQVLGCGIVGVVAICFIAIVIRRQRSQRTIVADEK